VGGGRGGEGKKKGRRNRRPRIRRRWKKGKQGKGEDKVQRLSRDKSLQCTVTGGKFINKVTD